MLRKIPVVLFLLLMTSCGALSNLSKNFAEAQGMIRDLKPVVADIIDSVAGTIEEGEKIRNQGAELFDTVKEVAGTLIEDMKDTVAEMKAMEKASFKKADKDGDGNLDFMERITYLVMLAAGGAEVARRKMKKTQEQIAELHGRVDHERSKRKS